MFFQRVPPLRIDDLIEDLKDGTKLLALLEVLSGEKLVSEKPILENTSIIFQYFSLWRRAEYSEDLIF